MHVTNQITKCNLYSVSNGTNESCVYFRSLLCGPSLFLAFIATSVACMPSVACVSSFDFMSPVACMSMIV